jgi:hypothetical protein
VCAVVAPVAIATASSGSAARATPARVVRTLPSQTATVRIGAAAAVAPTPTAHGFLGIATSLSTIPGLSGPPTALDTPFIQLLKNLSPGAPPVLRIGGNSGDDSWWPIPGMKEPNLYALSPQWGDRVHALLSALGGKAIIGVNLEMGPKVDYRIAKVEVADFNRYVGPGLIDAFELGNEPEFFPLSVVQKGGRGHDTIAAYGKLFSHVASELGGAPLAGPGSVGPVWLNSLGTVLGDLPSRLKLVTAHAYALMNCSRLAHLSIPDFFTPASIQGLADSVHSMVEAAAVRGKPVRLDEINGITCGGKAGLSNTFGEALWALNVLPALWQAGVQGVNFQSIYGDHNQVIHASRSNHVWTVSVEPEYYGLLAFAQAAPAGSRLLSISSPDLSGSTSSRCARLTGQSGSC